MRELVNQLQVPPQAVLQRLDRIEAGIGHSRNGIKCLIDDPSFSIDLLDEIIVPRTWNFRQWSDGGIRVCEHAAQFRGMWVFLPALRRDHL